MNKHDDNPYAAPQSNTGRGPTAGRPKSPKVFGILALIFAAFGLLNFVSMGMTLLQAPERANPLELPLATLLFSNAIGIVSILLLFAAGMGLVQYQDKGRRWFNWYAVFTVVFTVINTLLTYRAMMKLIVGESGDPSMAGVAAGSLVIGIAVALAFPIIGYIMLNRPVVKGWLH